MPLPMAIATPSLREMELLFTSERERERRREPERVADRNRWDIKAFNTGSERDVCLVLFTWTREPTTSSAGARKMRQTRENGGAG